ncbi:MAG: hypothetical protein HZY75_05200 [Nocardioidaceae bacterium]|nr:MAG: hypothetical protein HZY75_05200 [Nocardioidaceae bacterium]
MNSDTVHMSPREVTGQFEIAEREPEATLSLGGCIEEFLKVQVDKQAPGEVVRAALECRRTGIGTDR